MTETATGTILRVRPLTESSLIVQWLAEGQGRLSTVAKGARQPKSSFRGKLDLFYEADFSFVRARRSELHILREVSLRDPRALIRRDLGYLRQAAYCAALIEQATETATPLPVIPELMRGFLDALPLAPCSPHMLMAFELKLLAELGFEPNWAETRLNAGATAVARTLMTGSWESFSRLRPSATQIADLRQFLHGFLIYHLGRIPRNRMAALGETVILHR
ncbi:MAG TPA: DNA repair protein RecO [Verrucomicrobiae bacterium]|nr:DNA repair protein RecO [Verrucomicrobiae bacterium]